MIQHRLLSKRLRTLTRWTGITPIIYLYTRNLHKIFLYGLVNLSMELNEVFVTKNDEKCLQYACKLYIQCNKSYYFFYIEQFVSVPASTIPTHHEHGVDQRLWYHLRTGKQTNWQNDKSLYPLHHYLWLKKCQGREVREIVGVDGIAAMSRWWMWSDVPSDGKKTEIVRARAGEGNMVRQWVYLIHTQKHKPRRHF